MQLVLERRPFPSTADMVNTSGADLVAFCVENNSSGGNFSICERAET